MLFIHLKTQISLVYQFHNLVIGVLGKSHIGTTLIIIKTIAALYSFVN